MVHHIQWYIKKSWPYDIIEMFCIVCVAIAPFKEVLIVLVPGFKAPEWAPTPHRQRLLDVSVCNCAHQTAMAAYRRVFESELVFFFMLPYHLLLTGHTSLLETHSPQSGRL